MQNILQGVFSLWVTLCLLATPANAQDSTSSISLVLNGRKLELKEQIRAFVTEDQGLLISAGGGKDGPHLSIQLPKPAPGAFTLENAPGARISYAYSQSLDLRDHFQAGKEKLNARLLVTVVKFGEIGQPIEGTFTATVENQQGKALALTEGKFFVIRVEPPKGQKPQTPGILKVLPTK